MVDIEGTQRFHGHLCPGLAVGIRVAQIALREIGPHSADEEIVAIVETDMCGVDAIQYLTGCTFGKGNMIHLDYGKNAFTFVRRSDGKAIRIVLRHDALGEPKPERESMVARVRSGQAAPEEIAQYQALRSERLEQILHAPEERLFEVRPVQPRVPRQARVLDSVLCDECGEMTMETRTRRFQGRMLCIPCFEAVERRL